MWDTLLKATHEHDFKEIILGGHPGILTKLIRGDFNTHSSKAKPANDIIINLLENKNIKENVIGAIKESTTAAGIIQEIRKAGKIHIFNKIAENVEISASGFLKNKIKLGVVLFDMSKQTIGMSGIAQNLKK